MPINEVYIFTYDDYLAIMHLRGLYCVAEEKEEYKLETNPEDGTEYVNGAKQGVEEKEIHQKHDKSFKEALSNKEEMVFLLREFVGIDVTAEELQEYKNEFITKKYGKRQSDIIYKNTKKEIYYIVEHQSRKDRRMPYRITEYCLELIENVVKNSKHKIYPTIVPIVLYTGKGNWDVETNFAERQINSEGTYEEYKIDIKYTVIDINIIEDMELLEKQDYLANIILMETCKTNEKRAEMFKKIYNRLESKEEKEKILHYIINIYEQTLKPEEVRKFYENLERSDEPMTAMYQYIIQEKNENIRKGMEKGMEKGRIEVAKNLLKLKIPIQQIIEATGLSEEKVEEISNSLTQKST